MLVQRIVSAGRFVDLSALMSAARRIAAPLWRALFGFLVTASGCAVDTFPLPDEFDAAFVTGDVCMPSNIKTGVAQADGAPEYPLRIQTCAYRCISIDRSTVSIRNSWVCAAGQCDMTLLATAHVLKSAGQDDCDARDLPDPPSSECHIETFDVMVSPPCCADNGNGSEYVANSFRVSVPYLDLDQGEEVVGRINQGEAPGQVVQEVIGIQNYPERQFVVNFDPSHPEVTSHDALTAESCHHIPAP